MLIQSLLHVGVDVSTALQEIISQFKVPRSDVLIGYGVHVIEESDTLLI